MMTPLTKEDDGLLKRSTIRMNYSVPKNPFKEFIDSFLGGKSSTNHSSCKGSFITTDKKKAKKVPLMPSMEYEQKFETKQNEYSGYSKRQHNKGLRSKIMRDSVKPKKYSPQAIRMSGLPLRSSLTKLRSSRKIKYY
uniref:Uncharacterized protein n=1 Tax=Euplotes crassus TaxID=5936 RepID=A0A7S3NVM6_EUPCR|mmetsp:Transcript_26232/g.26135  ORF Transcript_26232/g.26135 Transcript_26232/m.26135 type:complete len:137 (+) Transcript_26232:718-1128(+)